MLLDINGFDYSKKLVNSYNLNKQLEYNEWVDSNGKKHKELTREYISGTVNIKLTEKEYNSFLTNLEAVKTGNLYKIKVYSLNTKELIDIDCYITFFPKLKKDISTGKIYDIVEVTIEQK